MSIAIISVSQQDLPNDPLRGGPLIMFLRHCDHLAFITSEFLIYFLIIEVYITGQCKIFTVVDLNNKLLCWSSTTNTLLPVALHSRLSYQPHFFNCP